MKRIIINDQFSADLYTMAGDGEITEADARRIIRKVEECRASGLGPDIAAALARGLVQLARWRTRSEKAIQKASQRDAAAP